MAAVSQPAAQHVDVAPVCPPGHVECVAYQRDQTQRAVERNIDKHASDQVLWRTEGMRLADDEERQRRRDGVANAGDEPDQGVDAKPDIRTRDNKCGIEQRGERVDARNALRVTRWCVKIHRE